jgi:hypothetical protein
MPTTHPRSSTKCLKDQYFWKLIFNWNKPEKAVKLKKIYLKQHIYEIINRIPEKAIITERTL